MPKVCTAVNDIKKGDAVCVVGFDAVTHPSRPVLVAQASSTTLASSRTVLGIAQADADDGTAVNVSVSGDVVEEDVTGLGAGSSRLVVTDYRQTLAADQCRLKRIDDSSGGVRRSEVFVVGTVDQEGNVAVQPRHASDETGYLQTFNVRAYGAVGDDVADDLPAFNAAMAAMSSVDPSIGAILEVPAGTYFLDGDLHIERRLVMRGLSTGNGFGSTLIHFAAGYGLFVERDNTSPDGGSGEYCIIENLDIESRRIELSPRPVSAAAALDSVVYGTDENRYYFKCTTAGTTGPDDPFNPRPTLAIGEVIADGTAEWTVCTHAGITMRAAARVRNVLLQYFTNAAVLIKAPYGDEIPGAAADCWQLDHIFISTCGMGVCVEGGECQVGTARDLNIHTCGDAIPGTGGHGVFDFSQFGNTWIGAQCEGITGRSYWAVGALTCAVFLGCYTEGDVLPPLMERPAVLVGGASGSNFDPASQGLILSPGQSRNVNIRDQANGTEAGLDLHGSATVMWFKHDNDNGLIYSNQYGSVHAGEWSFMFGGARALYGLLGEGAASGKGNWRDIHGHFLGDDAVEEVFIGSATARTDKYVRGGFFKVGDQFWTQGTGACGSYAGWTVRKNGFRGVQHVLGTSYVTSNVFGGVADMVEPASLDPDQPAEGTSVYRCVTSGTSDPVVVPDWASAPNVGNTVNDGTVVWENVGTVALYSRIGVLHEQGRVTTTDDTPTVIATYPLADNTITYVDVVVLGMRTDDDAAGSYVWSGSWYRRSGGAAVAVRTPTQEQGDGTWTVALSLSGNDALVTVTGEVGATINWTVTRKGSEAS